MPTSVSEIVGLVNRQKATVVYYSVAVGHLHAWLIVPTRGIVKFHQVRVSDADDEGERRYYMTNEKKSKLFLLLFGQNQGRSILLGKTDFCLQIALYAIM